MIQALAFLGAPALLVLWLAGLPAMWKGQPKVSLWASGAGIALGLLCAVSGMVGPRHDNFWTGNLGSGDGFGLIGLFLIGGLVAGVSFALLVLTAALSAHRADKAIQEVSE